MGSTSICPQASTSMVVNNDAATRKDVPCISVAIRSFVRDKNKAVELPPAALVLPKQKWILPDIRLEIHAILPPTSTGSEVPWLAPIRESQ